MDYGLNERNLVHGEGARDAGLKRQIISATVLSSLITLLAVLNSGCRVAPGVAAVEFTNVPLAEPGNPGKFVVIEGRVIAARRDSRIVLYARSESTWYVQPLANQPFTRIAADGSWRSSTHPGLEYAALLVGPDFHPPARTDKLPVEKAIASAVTKGKPPVWRRWWSILIYAVIIVGAAFTAHRLRMNQLRNELALRFEERLGERMRVAQILHDTLLQGVISASMQLHVAANELPVDAPASGSMRRVLASMGRVIEEGHNTLRSLRSPMESTHELERSLSRIPQDLNLNRDVRFRVTVKGPTLPMKSAICGPIYRVGREALADAFCRFGATHAQVELRYGPSEFQLVVRHNGRQRYDAGVPDLEERAAGIGARLETRKRMRGGTEVRLAVPGELAFKSSHAERASIFAAWFRRRRSLPERAGAACDEGR